eukprot:3275460-Rhodomonas_salina.2
MKAEIIADSVGSRIPPSLLTPSMECRYLLPFHPLRYSLVPVNSDLRIFLLHLRADSRMQSWDPYCQQGRAAPVAREQHTSNSEQDLISECNPVDPIPYYAQDELEEWTSHLHLTKQHNIHWVCLQSSSLAKALKEEQVRWL